MRDSEDENEEKKEVLDEAEESEELDRLELVNDDGLIGSMDAIRMNDVNLSRDNLSIPLLNNRTRGSVHRPIVTESKVDHVEGKYEDEDEEELKFEHEYVANLLDDEAESVSIQRVYTLPFLSFFMCLLSIVVGIVLLAPVLSPYLPSEYRQYFDEERLGNMHWKRIIEIILKFIRDKGLDEWFK